MIHSILKEISLLNTNGVAADMIIIANFVQQKQFDIIRNLLQKYKIQNMEIVPLLGTSLLACKKPSRRPIRPTRRSP
jgi:hypothetical protein